MRPSRLVITSFLVCALAVPAAALADNGHGRRGPQAPPSILGPYSLTEKDGSSCGLHKPWANDTLVRTYAVTRIGKATYRIERRDRGSFVTNGLRTPGHCQTQKHGSSVQAGVTGTFHGLLVGVVSGGTFDAKATCAADCGRTDVWISTFFGPNAQFSCFAATPAQCRYNFEYSAPARGLKFHHWQDTGVNDVEVFHGDIATR